MQRHHCHLLFWLVLGTVGCGSSHVSPDGSLTTDAGEDAAPDATPPDAAPDATVTGCTGEATEGAGAGCFCQGPFDVAGTLAYRSAYELEVIDVGGDAPALIRSIPQSRPGSEGAVHIARDHLFVGGWGLEIYDLAEPTSPRSVFSVGLPGTVTDLSVLRATLWLGFDGDDGSASLIAYDVSDPTLPRRFVSLPLDGQPGSVLVHGEDRVVVLEARRFGETGPDVATVVDISRPSSPSVVTRIPLEGSSALRRRGVLVGDLLHVAGRDPVLQTVDLTLERVVGTLDAPDGTTDFGIGISAAAGLVFVGSGAILVADVSPPTAPRWLGQLAPHSGDPFYTQAMGDRLIVSNGNRLDVIALDCR